MESVAYLLAEESGAPLKETDNLTVKKKKKRSMCAEHLKRAVIRARTKDTFSRVDRAFFSAGRWVSSPHRDVDGLVKPRLRDDARSFFENGCLVTLARTRKAHDDDDFHAKRPAAVYTALVRCIEISLRDTRQVLSPNASSIFQPSARRFAELFLLYSM